MSVLQNAKELCQMMEQGKMMDAFEKFYHNDVVVVDGEQPKREGKDAQREALHQWAGQTKEIHGMGIKTLTTNEDNGKACIESWVDVTFQDGNRVKMEEVAVQQWKDGQIVHERFYYTTPGS